MQTFDIIPQGVCCRRMHVTVDEGRVVSASFEGGCHGNLQGIGSLIAGMPVEEVVKRLKGIQCGMKALLALISWLGRLKLKSLLDWHAFKSPHF